MVRTILACFCTLALVHVVEGVSLTNSTDGQTQFYRGLDRDDVIFEHNVMFVREARSVQDCAALCTLHPNCLTFTSNLQGTQNTSCRGHSSVMLSTSVATFDPGSRAFQVVSPPTSCQTPFDQDTLTGNWTVIQRRCDGSLDFYRNWTEYQVGFGNPDSEFWLGLEKLHTLTSLRPYQLRFDLEQWNGTTGYAVYSNFYVGPASDGYRINYSAMIAASNVIDRLSHSKACMFSTPDVDNDRSPVQHCAVVRQSSWWHHNCTWVNPMGPYLPLQECWNCPFFMGFGTSANSRTALKRIQMKIRSV